MAVLTASSAWLVAAVSLGAIPGPIASLTALALGALCGAVAYAQAKGRETALNALAEKLRAASPDGAASVDAGGDALTASVERLLGALSTAERGRDAAETGAADAETAHRARVDTLAKQLGGVVRAASAGDFSRRISGRFDEPALQSIANDVDGLCAGMAAFVRDLNAAAGALAAGDLTGRVSGAYEGDLNTVAAKVNASFERLSGLVARIKQMSGGIERSATSIADGAEALSGRTEAQASSLEETAATMEQMAASVKINADSARQATSLADTASAGADKTQRVVAEAVDAMRRIEGSSERIAEIITVIESIAFQTNLLALNAAVEAARAGDAGKGFAVVANEVRTLAQRSSDAARDITQLIDDSSAHVGEGVRAVEATGGALEEMIDAIRGVGGAIGGISTASAEQASGVEEITSTVSHLDQMTQQNAAMAERSAAAARELSNDGGILRQLIDTFHVDPRARAAQTA